MFELPPHSRFRRETRSRANLHRRQAYARQPGHPDREWWHEYASLCFFAQAGRARRPGCVPGNTQTSNSPARSSEGNRFICDFDIQMKRIGCGISGIVESASRIPLKTSDFLKWLVSEA